MRLEIARVRYITRNGTMRGNLGYELENGSTSLIHAGSSHSMTALSRPCTSLAKHVGSRSAIRSSGCYWRGAVSRQAGHSYRQSSSIATPKRLSPYRLIPLPTFLADFAPLHVKGWRLEVLPGICSSPTLQDEGMAQLQDRRLVRRYDFEHGKDGWRSLMAFTENAGNVVEKEDVRFPP